MVSRTNKFRGSRTHGRGKKSGRGAGIHGGRGNAGLHKHKFMHMLKYDPEHFGPRGFSRPPKVVESRKGITVASLGAATEEFLRRGYARQDEGKLTVDLSAAGYYKLIAGGGLSAPLNVVVEKATERAVKAVEKAGGSVTLK